MKYILDDKKHGVELAIQPSDDDGPDHVLWVYPRTQGDSLEIPGVVYIKISQFYEFMDWLKSWAPDPRQIQR